MEINSVKEITTMDKAPITIGYHSQALIIKDHEMLFRSGQISIDPVTGEIISGNAAKSRYAKHH
jgi:enamine deaminase RidA (YjgF/YER057c/UK114 family)